MERVGTLYLKARVEIFEIFQVVHLFAAFEKERSKWLRIDLLKRVVAVLAEPVPTRLDFLPWRRDKQGKVKVRISHLKYINEALKYNSLLNGDPNDPDKSSFSEKAFMRLLTMLATKLGGMTAAMLSRNLTQNEYVYANYCALLKELFERVSMYKAVQQGPKYAKALESEFTKLDQYLSDFESKDKPEKKEKMPEPYDFRKTAAVYLLEPC